MKWFLAGPYPIPDLLLIQLNKLAEAGITSDQIKIFDGCIMYFAEGKIVV